MFILFFGFLVSCIIILSLVCKDITFNLSLICLSLKGMFTRCIWNFDYIVFVILLMLFVCFGYALFYTGHYFSKDSSGNYLKLLICFFVSIMASLVLTGDFLLTLIFWEYLGVVRFFLILFYLNYLRLRASIVTLVSSRFGDVCLFLLVMLSSYKSINPLFIFTVFRLIVFTKRASFPFISWLLEAMRAPTPVSSLVHSSTLVAAGVWFRVRYDLLVFRRNVIFIILILFITIMITGICCFWFIDLKKIVALSTCNNIAWCLIYLILGDVCLCLFQLLRHGVSKCLLFMLVGDVMRGTGGSQARNCVYSPQLYGRWGIFSLLSIVLGLSGAPFIGVFFTKHLLLSEFCGLVNVPMLIIMAFCVFVSYFYSFRLCRILYKLNSSVSSGVYLCFRTGLMVYFWLFVNFFVSKVIEETNKVSYGFSVALIIFQMASCISAYYLYQRDLLSMKCSSLWGCDKLVESTLLAYKSVLNLLVIFIYRWDKYILSILNFNESSILKVYKKKMLKVLLFSLLIFILRCLFILY